MSKDYYKILGIERGASADEVKRAFRTLAHKHHPDKQGGNEAKFKEANEAYQVLGNAEKRKQYDQYGSNFDNIGAGGFGGGQGFGGFNGGGVNINMEDLGDIFGEMFGMGGGRTRTKTKSRGADIEMNLTINFKDSIFGVEKNIELYKNVNCEACNGIGAESGSNVNTCGECNGNGSVKRVQNTVFGSIARSVICPRCKGDGNIIEKQCKKCSGVGIRKKSITIKVKIPAGIRSGETLRITGAGESVGNNGIPGDLYININVEASAKFKREGNNILMHTPLNFKTATLGGYIEVDTLNNKMKIKIPAGTQSGQVLRLKGQGVAEKGDLLVEIFITVPEKLSKKQKKILEEWE